MTTKKYSSYADIDRDLEILNLERQINYQKLVLSVDKTKESLLPSNLISGLFSSYKSITSNIYVIILQFVIPCVINWLKNRKRGD